MTKPPRDEWGRPLVGAVTRPPGAGFAYRGFWGVAVLGTVGTALWGGVGGWALATGLAAAALFSAAAQLASGARARWWLHGAAVLAVAFGGVTALTGVVATDLAVRFVRTGLHRLNLDGNRITEAAVYLVETRTWTPDHCARAVTALPRDDLMVLKIGERRFTRTPNAAAIAAACGYGTRVGAAYGYDYETTAEPLPPVQRGQR